jgi:hypothetical protein
MRYEHTNPDSKWNAVATLPGFRAIPPCRHLLDFRVNGVEVGTQDREVKLPERGMLHVRLKASACLAPLGARTKAWWSTGSLPF